MKTAYINGIILNGHEDMVPTPDLVVRVDGETIAGIVLVGLGGRYCKRNIAVQFQHGQTGNFPHSGVVVLHPQDEVDIRGVHQVGHDIIALVASVEDNNSLAVEAVPFDHFHQCARLVLFGGGLDNRVKVGVVVDVKQGTQMQLVVPSRRAVIADKAGRIGIAGHVDCGAVTGQSAAALVATIGLAVCAGGCEV